MDKCPSRQHSLLTGCDVDLSFTWGVTGMLYNTEVPLTSKFAGGILQSH